MSEPQSRTIIKLDWLLIGALIALVLPLRLWLLYNTEVTARDSIGYIRYALQFEKLPWHQVIASNHQHPGYPVLVWLVSVPVRAISGEMTPENMELSAQLVNVFASLLLMLPVYFLGRQFFDRTVSFCGTLLYQILPISAHHLSDGISEPFFLVLLVSALLHGVHAIRDRHVWRAALCGLFTGLAYLTRPEGALVLPAFGLVLVAVQLRPAWRSSWPRFFACGTAAVFAAALAGSVYVYATGSITNKPSAKWLLKKDSADSGNESRGLHLFAATFPKAENKALQVTRSSWALVSEINQGFHYVAGIPCLLGVFWSFGSLRRLPGFWFVATFCALHGLVLVALATSLCYVSDRHVMVLVLLGCFFVVVGLRELPRRLLSSGDIRENSDTAFLPSKTWVRSAPAWFAFLLLALVLFCLPRATQRLHGNRVGNHAAGRWLATQLKVGDHVVDDHSWSHFVSGWLFTEGDNPKLPPSYIPTCYVVTTRSRDPEIDRQRRTAGVTKDAKVVYVWPERTDPEMARVIVYAQPRDWDSQRWEKAKN